MDLLRSPHFNHPLIIISKYIIISALTAISHIFLLLVQKSPWFHYSQYSIWTILGSYLEQFLIFLSLSCFISLGNENEHWLETFCLCVFTQNCKKSAKWLFLHNFVIWASIFNDIKWSSWHFAAYLCCICYFFMQKSLSLL